MNLKKMMQTVNDLESMTPTERQAIFDYFVPMTPKTPPSTTQSVRTLDHDRIPVTYRMRRGKYMKYSPEQKRRIIEFGDTAPRSTTGKIRQGYWRQLVKEFGLPTKYEGSICSMYSNMKRMRYHIVTKQDSNNTAYETVSTQ